MTNDLDPTKIKPIKTKILVKQNKKQETTESGIILKEFVNRDPIKQTFTVLSVGSTVTAVQVGDVIHAEWQKVLKNPSASVRLSQSEDLFYIFDESDVIAVCN